MVKVIVISAVVASVLSSILNRNTVGTQDGYFKRWLGIFFVTAFIIGMNM